MAINCHPIFTSCQSVYATQLIPHTKCLWHVAHRHRKIEKREDMWRYACRDLVCKDHKGSDGVNGKAQKEAWLIWWLPENVSLFNLSIRFDCISSVFGDFKRDAFGTGVSDQRMNLAMWYGIVTTGLSKGNGSDAGCGEMQNHGLRVSETTWAEICTSEQFGSDFTVKQIGFLFCKLHLWSLMWVRVPARYV